MSVAAAHHIFLCALFLRIIHD